MNLSPAAATNGFEQSSGTARRPFMTKLIPLACLAVAIAAVGVTTYTGNTANWICSVDGGWRCFGAGMAVIDIVMETARQG